MGDRILVVDDEREITDLVELYLRSEDYEVLKFYEAREALACIERERLDLAILDIMMPDVDGLTLCQKIREKYNYPVIMLTARDGEMDQITGLSLGADDYITKPFRPLELLARVKAQLRRYKRYGNAPDPGAETAPSPVLTCAELELNPVTHVCLLDGEPLSLTPTEFSILQILLERKGEVVGSEELFHAVWKEEYYTRNNTITVHIRHLREKLKDSFERPRFIRTVWGVGYKIDE